MSSEKRVASIKREDIFKTLHENEHEILRSACLRKDTEVLQSFIAGVLGKPAGALASMSYMDPHGIVDWLKTVY